MEWFEIVAMIVACILLFISALFSLSIVINAKLRLELVSEYEWDQMTAGILGFIVFILALVSLVILIEMMIES